MNILIVHSSADLYGSDRSLLDLVRNCGSGVHVTVVLPENGILVKELVSEGVTVEIGEVCKIQRDMFSPFGVVKVLLSALRTVRFLGKIRPQGGFDLVYSNTLAVIGGAICARLWGVPHVWHVREIMSSSRLFTTVFRFLVSRFSIKVVCNSGQTLSWINPVGNSSKYQVIWNGFDAPPVANDRQSVRADLGASDHDVLFVLVGRINRWKGQKLLVQALSLLSTDVRQRMRVAIVGSAPFGQEHYEAELANCISDSNCSDRILVLPFQQDIGPIWDAADVVVVPSTEPEPFGRVAIEAMGFAKPVIAASHGGLTEIVREGETGLLVAPNSAELLAEAMQTLATNETLRLRMGMAGQARHIEFFTVNSYVNRVAAVLSSVANPKKTILFFHQSSEMYGSDKVLLWLVEGLKAKGFEVIVLVPTEGPLLAELRRTGVETHIVEVTKLNREILSLIGLMKLPFKLFASLQEANRVIAGRNIDVVYSNTLAVLGGAIYARISRLPHLWHVHELLKSPNLVRKGYPLMLRLMADKVVCNSTMTEKWLMDEQPALAIKTLTIWNGLGPRPLANATASAGIRKKLSVQDGQLLVALVGRINRWKGQDLMIEVATQLFNNGINNVHYAIVGGVAPGQKHLVDALEKRIDASPVRSQIHLMEFTADVWNIWDACDIAVVPSTEPEPFGMVAIEAMASKKPVLVAGHGGLLDIVEDGVSGLIFKPNDVNSFADQLQKLIVSDKLRTELGEAGCARQIELFSLDSQVDRTVEVILQMTSRNNADSAI